MNSVAPLHDHDVDDDDCGSCWTTVSSEEYTAEEKDMNAICCYNNSQIFLSGPLSCRNWFLMILVSSIGYCLYSARYTYLFGYRL